MTIGERAVGDITILDIGGRMAVQDGADAFREAVQQLVSRGRVKLVVNLRAVPYIDSTALDEIVRAYNSITRGGGSLKLVNLTAKVHELFEVTGLLSVFECFDTELKALESFGHRDTDPGHTTR